MTVRRSAQPCTLLDASVSPSCWPIALQPAAYTSRSLYPGCLARALPGICVLLAATGCILLTGVRCDRSRRINLVAPCWRCGRGCDRVVLGVGGGLLSTVYDFAGGDAEWEESGGSRLVLIERVIEVTMRNPITGLAPPGYRPYANMQPLAYGRAWLGGTPGQLAQQLRRHLCPPGLLALSLFAWFVFEVFRLGRRLHRRFVDGFAAVMSSACWAAGVGIACPDAVRDWILPSSTTSASRLPGQRPRLALPRRLKRSRQHARRGPDGRNHGSRQVTCDLEPSNLRLIDHHRQLEHPRPPGRLPDSVAAFSFQLPASGEQSSIFNLGEAELAHLASKSSSSTTPPPMARLRWSARASRGCG